MKVGNVSFGIRYDHNTFNVLANAKLNGLNTEKLEANLEDLRLVEPEKVLYTESERTNPKRIYSMYIANPKDMSEKSYIITNVDARDLNCYRINQSIIDEITKNLQEYKKMVLPQVYLVDKKMVEKESIGRLGKPV